MTRRIANLTVKRLISQLRRSKATDSPAVKIFAASLIIRSDLFAKGFASLMAQSYVSRSSICDRIALKLWLAVLVEMLRGLFATSECVDEMTDENESDDSGLLYYIK